MLDTEKTWVQFGLDTILTFERTSWEFWNEYAEPDLGGGITLEKNPKWVGTYNIQST